jgi:phytoene dehydrogenase-like protein
MTRSVDFDAVVIGAGLGGLSAASTLARGGQSVLVVERHDQPGGYATAFRRGGFSFEVSLHLMDAVGPGQPNGALLDSLTTGCKAPLSFRRPDVLRREIWPDCDLRIPWGMDSVLEVLAAEFPHEREGMRRLATIARMANETSREFDLAPSPTSDGWLSPSSALGRRTAAEVISSEIGDRRLQAMLSSFSSGWLGLPIERIAALPFLVAWYSYHHHGGYYPDGGSAALSQAIADSVEASGGRILLGCGARRIVVRRRRVEAVELDDGRAVTTRVVVSNANPLHTFGTLVDGAELDASYLRRLQGMEPSVSAVKVWLGLEGGLPPDAPRDYDTYLNNHPAALASPFDPETAHLSVVIPQNLDPGATQTKMSITMMMDARAYPGARAPDFKERAGDTLVRRVDQALMPGLTARIGAMEIGVPRTFERYTGNPGGSLYGWAPRLGQLGRLDAATPIAGLWLAGAWTPPGGGFTSVLRSGRRTGHRILEASKKRRGTESTA